jgi:single-stranded-DNA-specific exonuclease
MALQVFKELGIILEDENDDGLPMYRWNQVQGKLDLVTSITFLRYSKQEVSP